MLRKPVLSLRQIILLTLLLVVVVEAQNAADSAAYLLRMGSANYDSVVIKRAMTFIDEMSSGQRPLFTAACMYRLQTITCLAGSKKGTARYGEQALLMLDSAEIGGADQYSVYTIRAYVSQLMAGLGITYGPKYGPIIGKNLRAMKALNPNGFDTRFVECVNLLEMPPFIGGNPAKALPQLDALYRDYPDSTAVGISLARALVKTGNTTGAAVVLDRILAVNPGNLMAKKERGALR